MLMDARRPIAVEVEPTTIVDHLKTAIHTKAMNVLQHVAPDELNLFLARCKKHHACVIKDVSVATKMTRIEAVQAIVADDTYAWLTD